MSQNNRDKFYVVTNWKTNYNKETILSMCQTMRELDLKGNTDLIIACPFPYMCLAREHLPENMHLAALNCYKSGKSAHIGEVTPSMLKDVGVSWVILGQSERRYAFNESDTLIAEKASDALNEDLGVIVCIGETFEDRSTGNTEIVLANQLKHLAQYIKNWQNVLLVYEPIWTIGTGKLARPHNAQTVLAFVRKWLLNNIPSTSYPQMVRLLYGGVITPANCENLALLKDLDGFFMENNLLKKEFLHMLSSFNVDN